MRAVGQKHTEMLAIAIAELLWVAKRQGQKPSAGYRDGLFIPLG